MSCSSPDTRSWNPKLFFVHVSSRSWLPWPRWCKGHHDTTIIWALSEWKRLTGFGETTLSRIRRYGATALLAFDHALANVVSSYCDVWAPRTWPRTDRSQPIAWSYPRSNQDWFGRHKESEGWLQKTSPGRTEYKLPPNGGTASLQEGMIIGFAACHYDQNSWRPGLNHARRENWVWNFLCRWRHCACRVGSPKALRRLNDLLCSNSVSNGGEYVAGKSLQLHLESLFKEDGARARNAWLSRKVSNRSRPFLPVLRSRSDYPAERLRRGVKPPARTAGGRYWMRLDWSSHLFTDSRASAAEFREMQSEGDDVEPVGLHKAFPEESAKLMSRSAFIDEIKTHLVTSPHLARVDAHGWYQHRLRRARSF